LQKKKKKKKEKIIFFTTSFGVPWWRELVSPDSQSHWLISSFYKMVLFSRAMTW
jgi:hypothetical protein